MTTLKHYEISTTDMTLYEQGVSFAQVPETSDIAIILHSNRGKVYSTIARKDFNAMVKHILACTRKVQNVR